MRIKTVALALLLAASFAVFAGCEQQRIPEQQRRLVVGFVDQLSESSWRDRIAASIADTAKLRGIQLISLSAGRTQDEQIQAVRSLITYRVNAIVLSPIVMRGWDNVLREAREAGIPVLLVHRHIQADEPGAIGAYVGSDYEEQGRIAAGYIRNRFAQQKETVKVMEIHGIVGSSDTSERSRGIRSTFNRDEKFDIFYSVSCSGMYSKAYELMSIYLSNSSRPDVLVSFSDSMTLGAIKAMEEKNIQPGKDIVVISFDAQQDAIELLKQGKINCIVETDPNVGDVVMDEVESLSESGEMGKEIVLKGRVFYDTDNPSDIAPRGY